MPNQPPEISGAGSQTDDGTPFGHYRLIELLGRGGMGEVWRAYDPETERIVALKLLPEHLSQDKVFQHRFRREARAAAVLNSPHVVPIHHYGDINGRLYVDMRLIDGRDLQAVLSAGPLEPGRAVRIIEQVARALHAAHKVGLVHRDVKPSNIMLDEDDYAYLIDFGLARAAGETGLTRTGSFIGSIHYMAPERFSAKKADTRADVYALACVLYECLTGHTPYPGESFEQQYAGHLASAPPRPSSTSPGVPTEFDRVTDRGLAKDPDQRYPTTLELAHAARNAATVPDSRRSALASPTHAAEMPQYQAGEPTLQEPIRPAPHEPLDYEQWSQVAPTISATRPPATSQSFGAQSATPATPAGGNNGEIVRFRAPAALIIAFAFVSIAFLVASSVYLASVHPHLHGVRSRGAFWSIWDPWPLTYFIFEWATALSAIPWFILAAALLLAYRRLASIIGGERMMRIGQISIFAVPIVAILEIYLFVAWRGFDVSDDTMWEQNLQATAGLNAVIFSAIIAFTIPALRLRRSWAWATGAAGVFGLLLQVFVLFAPPEPPWRQPVYAAIYVLWLSLMILAGIKMYRDKASLASTVPTG
jgi:serine/threonine protein kinase